MNRKIAVSALTIFAVAAAVVGATTAFYSDTETSRGNTLTAGAIDLGLDNESYYNGELNNGTTWGLSYDLDDGKGPGNSGAYLYFAMSDLKPGDYGEDTISLHVNNNDSWVCSDVTLTGDNDNGITEPEGDDGDTTDGPWAGELADAIDFIWWADDGDNVLESDEQTLPSGPLGVLGQNGTATVTIADSAGSIYPDSQLRPVTGAIIGAQTYYIGKGWCFGNLVKTPVTQDDRGKTGTNGPIQRGAGFTCDGANEDNMTQSDSLTATIAFRAEQERNNGSFTCTPR